MSVLLKYFRVSAKSFVLCSWVFGAAVQITKLGDHPLAADSSAVKAVSSVSHFHPTHFFHQHKLMLFYTPHLPLSAATCQDRKMGKYRIETKVKDSSAYKMVDIEPLICAYKQPLHVCKSHSRQRYRC